MKPKFAHRIKITQPYTPAAHTTVQSIQRTMQTERERLEKNRAEVKQVVRQIKRKEA